MNENEIKISGYDLIEKFIKQNYLYADERYDAKFKEYLKLEDGPNLILGYIEYLQNQINPELYHIDFKDIEKLHLKKETYAHKRIREIKRNRNGLK